MKVDVVVRAFSGYEAGALASNGRIIGQGWCQSVILGDVQAQLAHANRTII